MKFLVTIIVILLAVIAYRIPSPIEVGRGILEAQREAIAAAEKSVRDAQERSRQATEQSRKREEAADHERERQQQQADFDNLPKWDRFGKPINRDPPPGLRESAAIPANPVTPPPRTPTPEEKAAEILRKYGNKPNP